MTNTQPNTDWEEIIQDGEPERFADFVRDIKHLQQWNADRIDGRVRRSLHVKLYGGLSAEFKVLPNIPTYARYGVFKEAKTFPAWVRISNVFSIIKSDRLPSVFGFVVKLTDVEGLKLLQGEEDAQTQDFLAINQPFIPVRDARQLALIFLASKNLLTAPLKLIRELGLADATRLFLYGLSRLTHRVRSLALETYWGNVPIKLGPYAIKFKWQPSQKAKPASRVSLSRNYLRQELKNRLEANDITFDFMVQFYIDAEKTPIEGAFEWKAADAPFIKLAELTIPRQDLDSYQAKRQESYVDSLAFNAWHTLEDHRPIGNIQRARRVIYQASAINWGHAKEPGDI